MSQAASEIRDLLSGRPGGVNRVIRRFGPHVVDYVGAFLPDRSGPFDKVVEDILVDILAQSRAAARAANDDQVFEFGIECAFRTMRARHRELLDAPAVIEKATNSYTFDEVVQRTGMAAEDLRSAISEGRIRAVRMNDQMRVKGDGIKGLEERRNRVLYHLTAAERELLCLHHRLGFSPEVIARWSGETAAHIEALIHATSEKLSLARAGKAGGKSVSEDTEIRRYIDGRLSGDETAKFERRIIKDKIAQARLDELRTQGQQIRELFEGGTVDLSSISVNVRARNPHYAFALPPVAALWLQMVALVALMLVMHRVGGYIAPASIAVTVLAGDAAGVDAPASGRMYPGDTVSTKDSSQALLSINDANRVTLAPGTTLQVAEPRPAAQQVLRLQRGEIFGQFLAGQESLVLLLDRKPADERSRQPHLQAEFTSSGGAEFGLAIGDAAHELLPAELEFERARGLVTVLAACANGKLEPHTAEGVPGLRVDPPLQAGDRLLGVDGNVDGISDDLLRRRLMQMAPGESMTLTFLRAGQEISATVRAQEIRPWAVLRVFNGTVRLVAAPNMPDKTEHWVSQGQWMVLDESLAPLLGLKGSEDFRTLRLDAEGRFKQDIHWLRTDAFPLADDVSVLWLDRKLRALAQRLEAARADEIHRSGLREVQHFERWAEQAIAAAEARIAEGKPRDRDPLAGTLSDRELIGQREVILGLAEHWRRQASAGKYATLGEAAKTLHRPIQNDRDELDALGTQLARGAELKTAIQKFEAAIAAQDAELATLRASEFHDPEGVKSAPLRQRATELEAIVRAGAAARSRLDLLTLKLNELDERIDEQRRLLPGLQAASREATTELAAVDKDIAANQYTPEAMSKAEADVTSTKAALAATRTALEEATKSLDTAAAELELARTARAQADKTAREADAAREQAASALTTAVAERALAQKTLQAAQEEAARLKAELDKLPPEDPARAALQEQLLAAEKQVKDAEAALEAARTAADEAKTAQDKADQTLKAARDAAEAEAASFSVAESKHTAADIAKQEAAASASKAELAATAAVARVEFLGQQQTALVELQGLRTTAAQKLDTATAAERQCNDRLAALEADAAPRRTELSEVLAAIKEGEDAANEKLGVEAEIGRYDGVARAIVKHEFDRAATVSDRDALASADVVKNYDKTLAETVALEARIVTYEYLRNFALAQDSIFAHEQLQALDRLREAEAKASDEALEVLMRYCPEYTPGAYAQTFAGEDGRKLKEAVLRSLWKLYYNSGVGDAADEALCYYVVRQTGLAEGLEKLQVRWRSYLASALPEGRYTDLAKLTEQDLTTRSR